MRADATWLDQNQRVEQMTWCPGQPMLIKDRLVVHGGWIERKGVTCFNLYRPPPRPAGRRRRSRTLARSRPQDLSARTMPITASITWLAHRVQRPRREDQSRAGAGRRAGDRQGQLARAGQARGRVRGISTKCRRRTCSAGSTASPNRSSCGLTRRRDLGDIDRFKFYDHTKDLHRGAARRAAGRRKAPARTLRVQRPRLPSSPPTTRPMASICRRTIAGTTWPGPTTPKRTSRRTYWDELWSWYRGRRFRARRCVPDRARHLMPSTRRHRRRRRRRSGTSSTPANAPEDAELADVLDALGYPDAADTVKQLIAAATGATRRMADGHAGAAAPSRTGSSAAATARCATRTPRTATG